MRKLFYITVRGPRLNCSLSLSSGMSSIFPDVNTGEKGTMFDTFFVVTLASVFIILSNTCTSSVHVLIHSLLFQRVTVCFVM